MLELIAENLAPIMFLALIGFLLPMAALVAFTSWDFFVTSYWQNEGSSNYGGLPQWPVKFLIPLAFALLFLQGLSELIKRCAIINGDLPDDKLDSGHPAAARSAGHLEVPSISGDRSASQKK